MTAAGGWTIPEACAEFERAGLPVDEARFRMAIRAFQVPRAGETPKGPLGGRGQTLYDIGHLQLLHADFIRWRDRLET